MRILFALAGFNRYDRGAEIALLSVAKQLRRKGNIVTLIGSGRPRSDTGLKFLRAPSIQREFFERFPSIPFFRTEYAYEEFTFLPTLLQKYRPEDYDATITCSYPFTNWALRRPDLRGRRPAHIFVTQNGDWPAYAQDAEYRFFHCDGLICTNPDYFERNRARWNSCLIPNGVDIERFTPETAGIDFRKQLNIPSDRIVVLMVSALILTKRVSAGIEATSKIPNSHLVVAGDGPLRDQLDAEAATRLPGRFTRLTVRSQQMPDLYRSADIFLHMSKEESFGNVFLEAMASGLPIVAHDSPRLRWIVGDTEYLTDTENTDLVAAKFEEARAEPLDRRHGRVQLAASFSWENIADAYQSFLSGVVGTYSG